MTTGQPAEARGQQATGQGTGAGRHPGPVPAANLCRQPGRHQRPEELTGRRTLQHPPHRGGNQSGIGCQPRHQGKQGARHQPAHQREQQHAAVAHGRRQFQSDKGQPGAQRHHHKARDQQAARLRTAVQQHAGSDVAEDVHGRHQRHQHPQRPARDARLGINGGQKTDHRHPLRGIDTEGQEQQPRASAGERQAQLAAQSALSRLRYCARWIGRHPAPHGRQAQHAQQANQPPPAFPASRQNHRRPQQHGQRRAKRHIGAPDAHDLRETLRRHQPAQHCGRRQRGQQKTQPFEGAQHQQHGSTFGEAPDQTGQAHQTQARQHGAAQAEPVARQPQK